MVKPEGDIAVTHYCCGASLFHLMAYGGKRAEAVGLNLLDCSVWTGDARSSCVR